MKLEASKPLLLEDSKEELVVVQDGVEKLDEDDYGSFISPIQQWIDWACENDGFAWQFFSKVKACIHVTKMAYASLWCSYYLKT